MYGCILYCFWLVSSIVFDFEKANDKGQEKKRKLYVKERLERVTQEQKGPATVSTTNHGC